ncbi:MAG: GerMN domain-containing protein [Oscillospiraceae bacterium]|jgi:germination protein M|nr:GerMN domain-containing protein [Oscillospiraceae bacterium]
MKLSTSSSTWSAPRTESAAKKPAKFSFPKFSKKIAFKRQDIERMLIAGAAVLVLVLAAIGAPAVLPSNDHAVDNNDILPDVSAGAIVSGPSQKTTVYYSDAEGFLVPVQRDVSQTIGIAKATLNLMISSDENDLQAARLGLMTVIPDGTTYDLDIANGRARIDLSKNVLSLNDPAKESLMVSAIVQALTQFDSVQTVDFLIGGQKRASLTNGTDISEAMSGGLINLESVAPTMSVADAQLVKLYFPSENGRVLVPVTRAVWGRADINTAVFELIKGPKEDTSLHAALPSDTGLIDVQVIGGTATINFTDEFASLLTASDGGEQARRALTLTCLQFPGVNKVEILVNGKAFTPAVLEKPTYINTLSQAAVQFMDVIEID